MDKLITFIELCLRDAKATTGATRAKYYEQAFGAIQYHSFLYPDDITYKNLESLWADVYRPQFETLVYGG